MSRAALLWLLCAASACAADVSGAWQMSDVRENGQTHLSTLTLKVDGDKLSGTISSPLGTAPVTSGKVTGDDISFLSVRRAQYDEIVVSFTGKIDGDTMKLEMQYSGRPPVTITARRAAAK